MVETQGTSIILRGHKLIIAEGLEPTHATYVSRMGIPIPLLRQHTIILLSDMVPHEGFKPSRSSQSGQSPSFIRARRSSELWGIKMNIFILT